MSSSPWTATKPFLPFRAADRQDRASSTLYEDVTPVQAVHRLIASHDGTPRPRRTMINGTVGSSTVRQPWSNRSPSGITSRRINCASPLRDAARRSRRPSPARAGRRAGCLTAPPETSPAPSRLADEHLLSVVIGGIMMTLLALYWRSDPATHLGSFYGNAAVGCLGSLVTVVATKFWFERGSPERRVPSVLRGKGPKVLHEHSLTVVLVLTWIAWIVWYVRIDPNGKTGQVVGNIVSEWSQILSLVWFTEYLIEPSSKQSHG